MWFLFALISIILGLVTAIAKTNILFAPLTWFVLSIAFSVLGEFVLPNFAKKS